jgi:hypothetical protein
MIEKLKALYERATPGEWVAHGTAIHDNTIHEESRYRDRTACIATANSWRNCERQSLDDAAFIAAAHNAMPELLAMKARCEAAEADMKIIVDGARENPAIADVCACFACRFEGECPGYDRDDCFDWRGSQAAESEAKP